MLPVRSFVDLPDKFCRKIDTTWHVSRDTTTLQSDARSHAVTSCKISALYLEEISLQFYPIAREISSLNLAGILLSSDLMSSEVIVYRDNETWHWHQVKWHKISHNVRSSDVIFLVKSNG